MSYWYYLNGVVDIRSVENGELMPILTLDNTIRTIFVSSNKLKTTLVQTVNKIRVDSEIPCWMCDDNCIPYMELLHEICVVTLNSCPTGCNPSDTCLYLHFVIARSRFSGSTGNSICIFYVHLYFSFSQPIPINHYGGAATINHYLLTWMQQWVSALTHPP